MDAPCLACTTGPAGFAGHPELAVRTVGDARLSLRCRRCDSFWSRTYARGYFTWAAITERMAASPLMGIAVPPLATHSGPRPLPWRGGDAPPWLAALKLGGLDNPA